MDETLRQAIAAAIRDESAARLRDDFANALVAAFRRAGKVLWVDGAMFGPDRAEGHSPFEFGSDATVGLATVLQIAGELMSGVVVLFTGDNRYAAAALARQLVEVEYLAWAFGEAEDEAERWMRSSKEERLDLWQPKHIRSRPGSRFRGSDYGLHCGRGGHPSPEGLSLLPDHSAPDAANRLLFCDAVIHGNSVWDHALIAARKLGHEDAMSSLGEARLLSEARRQWRASDPFLPLLDALDPSRRRLAGSVS